MNQQGRRACGGERERGLHEKYYQKGQLLKNVFITRNYPQGDDDDDDGDNDDGNVHSVTGNNHNKNDTTGRCNDNFIGTCCVEL